jgi:hypothetical protein
MSAGRDALRLSNNAMFDKRGAAAAWVEIQADDRDLWERAPMPYQDEPLRMTGTAVGGKQPYDYEHEQIATMLTMSQVLVAEDEAAEKRKRTGAKNGRKKRRLQHNAPERSRAPMPYDIELDALEAAETAYARKRRQVLQAAGLVPDDVWEW